MKKLLLYFAVLLLVFNISACSSGGSAKDSPMLGEWILHSMIVEGEEVSKEMLAEAVGDDLPTIVISEDKTVQINFPDEEPEKGKWTQKGDTLNMDFGDEKYDAIWKNDKLTLSWQDGYIWVLEKVKN